MEREVRRATAFFLEQTKDGCRSTWKASTKGRLDDFMDDGQW